MLQLENIKKGFTSPDSRPVIVWEGLGDSKTGIGDVFRIVLTKKNSLVVEKQSSVRNAMEQHGWTKTTMHEIDAELLSRVLLDTMRELNIYLSA